MVYIDIFHTHLLKVVHSFNSASYLSSESFTDNVLYLHDLLSILTIYNYNKRECMKINQFELHTCTREIRKLFTVLNTPGHIKKTHIKNIIDDIVCAFSSMTR